MKLMIWIWMVALGIMLAWAAGAGAAEFILAGSEHLNVTESYDTGVLFDTSMAVVYADGYIGQAYVNDGALLRVARYGSRAVGTARVYDAGRVVVPGGSVYSLYAYGSSGVEVSDRGGVDHVFAYDNSRVDISRGGVGALRAYGSSGVTISGGGINRLDAYRDSGVDISDGCVGLLNADDDSTIDICGGSVQRLTAYGRTDITIHGYDFRATGGLSLAGDMVYGTGLLIGRWFDGTAWTIPIGSQAPGATIRTVLPEPATMTLLGLGLGTLLAWPRGRPRA